MSTIYTTTDFAFDVAQAGRDGTDEALVDSLTAAWFAAAEHLDLEEGTPRGCSQLSTDLWQLAHDACEETAEGWRMAWTPERLREHGLRVRAAHKTRADGSCTCED